MNDDDTIQGQLYFIAFDFKNSLYFSDTTFQCWGLITESGSVAIAISCRKEVYWDQSSEYSFWSLDSSDLRSIVKLAIIPRPLSRISNACREDFPAFRKTDAVKEASPDKDWRVYWRSSREWDRIVTIGSKLIASSRFLAASCHLLREIRWFAAVLPDLIRKSGWPDLWYKVFWWREIASSRSFISPCLWNRSLRLLPRLIRTKARSGWSGDVAATACRPMSIVSSRFYISGPLRSVKQWRHRSMGLLSSKTC